MIQIKETIRERLNLNMLLTHYGIDVNAKQQLICPFHGDNAPSATIKNNYFYCFGCQAKGDIFDFIMMFENIDFKDALAKASFLAGVDFKTNKIKSSEIRKATKDNAIKTIIKEVSETKYRILAKISRLNRNNLSFNSLAELDFLLDDWLKAVPDWVDLDKIVAANIKCNIESVELEINKMFWINMRGNEKWI